MPWLLASENDPRDLKRLQRKALVLSALRIGSSFLIRCPVLQIRKCHRHSATATRILPTICPKDGQKLSPPEQNKSRLVVRVFSCVSLLAAV
jgi:hypothetical protein